MIVLHIVQPLEISLVGVDEESVFRNRVTNSYWQSSIIRLSVSHCESISYKHRVLTNQVWLVECHNNIAIIVNNSQVSLLRNEVRHILVIVVDAKFCCQPSRNVCHNLWVDDREMDALDVRTNQVWIGKLHSHVVGFCLACSNNIDIVIHQVGEYDAVIRIAHLSLIVNRSLSFISLVLRIVCSLEINNF